MACCPTCENDVHKCECDDDTQTVKETSADVLDDLICGGVKFPMASASTEF